MERRIPANGNTDQRGSTTPKFLDSSVAKHVKDMIGKKNTTRSKMLKDRFIRFYLSPFE